MIDLEIVDSYIKDIDDYLFKGLVAGQANGSYGQNLIGHFKMMADYFKQIMEIENELGIDLVTLFKALKNGVYIKDNYNAFKINEDVNGDKWFITSIDNDVAYYHGDITVKQFVKRIEGSASFADEEYCPPEEVSKATGTWVRTSVRIKDYGKTWALTKEELK